VALDERAGDAALPQFDRESDANGTTANDDNLGGVRHGGTITLQRLRVF
jgi:hypothetical protein